MAGRYLYHHAAEAAWAEAAWKEDNRRLSNGDAFRRTVSLSLGSPVSRQ